MSTGSSQWHAAVATHFGFLIANGFDRVDVDDSSVWSSWVQYRSATAAVRISKSREFVRCEVQLIRLVDGEVPAYPIWITDARLDWALLDTVVEARQPDLMAEVVKRRGLGRDEVEDQLGFWSRVLRDVAGDFLEGSFAPLDDAAVLVRRRVAAAPQEVQVWIPEDAPEGAESAQEASVRGDVPPNVGVSVRRYRRGRRGKDDPAVSP